MIWQRTSARRPGTRRIQGGRSEPRPRVVQVAPMVVREPEETWWRTQAEHARPVPTPATTVAVLRDRDAGSGAVVVRLAELAVQDELLVVFGSGSCAHAGHHTVVAGLRGRLPRHDVVPVHVGHRGTDTRRHAAELEYFLDAGSLPVVVTASAVLGDVTAEISSYVRADRVVRVFGTPTGAELYQVWRRPEPGVN